jgi:hypothetical protein
MTGARSWIGSSRRTLLFVSVVVAFALATPATAGDPSIVLGADSIEYAGGTPPDCFGPSLLYDYGQQRVRSLVQEQLAAMVASGLESLRVFVVYDYSISENPYFVPARSGRLDEPFRTNLSNYLRDIRSAGFRRVTLAFDPRYSADPGHRFGPYDPATIDASWGLMSDTRSILKQFGPADTRVDLLNEGAPFLPLPDARINWLASLYPRYVDAFGAGDVTVSAAIGSSLSTLVETLKATGKPLPQWFDVHPRYDYAGALADLRRWDAELTAAGATTQTLVIGEAKYDDADSARAVSEFAQNAQHRVEEVMEWPAETNGVSGQSRCINPPYNIAAYATALWGHPPSATLTAKVTDKTTVLLTPQGRRVVALESGAYAIAVNDTSKERGFSFAGHSTTKSFRGRRLWHVSLRPGQYGQTGAVTVLAAG